MLALSSSVKRVAARGVFISMRSAVSRSSSRSSSPSRSSGHVVLAVLAALAATSTAAAPLAGRFSSPLGPLELKEEKDGVVKGTITDPKNACNFPKGTVVLDGSRLDDTCVAGSFIACKIITETCAGTIKGDTILLVTGSGSKLSGTIHLDGKGCKTPLSSDTLVMQKASARKPPPKSTPPPKVKAAKAASVDAVLAAAQTLITAGEAEEARKKCQEAITLDPDASQGWTCLAVTYYLRERYEEAFENYAKALEADPTNHDVYYNMACIYAILGKSEEAIQYLRLSVLNGFVQLSTLTEDADLKSLHGHPEFEKLKAGQF